MQLVRKYSRFFGLIISIFILLFSSSQSVFAVMMPDSDKINFRLGGGYFSTLDDNVVCGNASTTTLTGGDNPTKVWNFFKSQGLDDIHTAAIMGNIQQESTFNPLIIQNGGTTNDPSNISSGWGLVQWTPGRKVLNIADRYNITTPIGDIGTQLNIIWQEMTTGPTPAGVMGFLAKFNARTSIGDATNYFMTDYEAAGHAGPRTTFAENALALYGGSAPTGTVSTTSSSSVGGCMPNATLSPDCASANGSAKILCAAKAYDPASYKLGLVGGHQGAAAWHAACPIINASCYVDCSGLVNMALFDAFGVDLRQNTKSQLSDTKNWRRIQYSQVQPGDLVFPNSGHVEIIDHVNGSQIFTFGAHNASYAQPKQVGPTDYYADLPGNVYLHYIGKGSS